MRSFISDVEGQDSAYLLGASCFLLYSTIGWNGFALASFKNFPCRRKEPSKPQGVRRVRLLNPLYGSRISRIVQCSRLFICKKYQRPFIRG
jgi:hypothetical protein